MTRFHCPRARDVTVTRAIRQRATDALLSLSGDACLLLLTRPLLRLNFVGIYGIFTDLMPPSFGEKFMPPNLDAESSHESWELFSRDLFFLQVDVMFWVIL